MMDRLNMGRDSEWRSGSGRSGIDGKRCGRGRAGMVMMTRLECLDHVDKMRM